MKAFRRWVSDGWRTLAIVGAVILLVGGLFLFRLSSQTPAASAVEVTATQQATDYHQLADNPAFGPHKVLYYGLHLVHWDNLYALRLISVIFALTIVISFYLLVKLWTTPLVAVLSTILLMTSGWFLHYARLATPAILYGDLLVIIALGLSLAHSQWRKATLIALIGACTVAFYVPGMIWFVMAGLLWQRKLIWHELKKIPVLLTVLYVLVFFIILAPLVIAILRQPQLIKLMVGLPASLPNPIEFIKRLLNIPVQLFLRGPADPVLWLGRLPLLDIFTSVMAISGLYVVCLKWQFDRSKLLVGVLVVGSVLVALGGAVQISLLIPFMYCLAAIGIAYMLEEWLSVFPKNPLARNVGLSLMILAVAVACFYNVQQYFVAWHHAPATKAAFNRRLH